MRAETVAATMPDHRIAAELRRPQPRIANTVEERNPYVDARYSKVIHYVPREERSVEWVRQPELSYAVAATPVTTLAEPQAIVNESNIAHVVTLTRNKEPRYGYRFIKRMFDIIVGLIGCLMLLPIMLVTKISYLSAGDKAPIIYRQTRVGLHGEPFQMFKLRSMVDNADEVLVELLKDPKRRAEWEANQKFTDDPRITKVGSFLRKTSLDEFPQFINVVRGDMSVIGPRPLVEGELEAHNGSSLYHKVKPGVTGWWGCNGRSNTNYSERLELEYHYVENCSVYLDVVCFSRTCSAVLKRKGAQ